MKAKRTEQNSRWIGRIAGNKVRLLRGSMRMTVEVLKVRRHVCLIPC